MMMIMMMMMIWGQSRPTWGSRTDKWPLEPQFQRAHFEFKGGTKIEVKVRLFYIPTFGAFWSWSRPIWSSRTAKLMPDVEHFEVKIGRFGGLEPPSGPWSVVFGDLEASWDSNAREVSRRRLPGAKGVLHLAIFWDHFRSTFASNCVIVRRHFQCSFCERFSTSLEAFCASIWRSLGGSFGSFFELVEKTRTPRKCCK